MKFGLKKENIEAIQDILSQFSCVEKAIIYGSRAKGCEKPGSDIDLTLIGNLITISILLKISVSLDELMLPYSFDLSIYHKIDNPDLIDHIHRVGLELYVRK